MDNTKWRAGGPGGLEGRVAKWKNWIFCGLTSCTEGHAALEMSTAPRVRGAVLEYFAASEPRREGYCFCPRVSTAWKYNILKWVFAIPKDFLEKFFENVWCSQFFFLRFSAAGGRRYANMIVDVRLSRLWLACRTQVTTLHATAKAKLQMCLNRR